MDARGTSVWCRQANGLGRWCQAKKNVLEVCPNTLILPLKTEGILGDFKR
jgi:hypothetical protein